MIIDLVGPNGDKVGLYNKGEVYANQYLTERQCYELNIVTKGPNNEDIYSPLKFNGFCVRSIEEDLIFEENESKVKKNKKK